MIYHCSTAALLTYLLPHTHTHRLEILSDSFIYLFYLFSRRKNTQKGHEAVEMILSVLRKSD